MSEKKNIDQLFQNKFEHFEVPPPEMAWGNIQAKLEEKEKKKRIIPFWWELAGVAAILLLGIGLYSVYFSDTSPTKNPIVNQDKTTPHQKENGVSPPAVNTTIPNETVVQGQEKEKEINTGTNTINPSIDKNNTLNKNQNNNKAVVSVSNEKNKTANLNQNKFSTNVNSNNALASTANQTEPNKKKQSNTAVGKLDSKEDNNINTSITTNVSERKTTKQKNPLEVITPSNDRNNITNQDRKTDLSISENPQKTQSEAELSGAKLEEIKKIDSTKLAVVEPNALEELLNEKEKKITKEQKINRWQVTPNVAPIYFRSLSNGSPLDEKLAANEKVYGTNYSYGLAVNYTLNKKYSIRTGVQSYSVDYDTKDIVFYQDTNASKMQNLSPNTQGAYIQIDPLHNVNTSFGRILGEKFEGSLNQKTSYIEVPLEVTYKVLSRKFGIDVIGGISTLFLNQNDVYLKSTSFNMKIGEASNLNPVHFSTNIGLGLKYAFWKRFDARIEPLFKYQINTYSSGAGNFKPYVFGIYSGISYHF
jgi:hypothetical protein